VSAVTERDLNILRHTWRYRATVPEVLHLLFFRGLTLKAVERVTTRLQREGLLQSFPLFGRSRYFTLTSKAARLLGVSEKWLDKPMGPQALIQNVCILAASCLGPTRRERMTAEEFAQRFPALVVRGVGSSRYHLDRDAASGLVRLGLFVPDFQSDRRRLVRKVRREFDRRMRHPAWNRLIRDGLFSATVLTGFPKKAEALREALGREKFPHRVEVVPYLAQLLVQEGTA
jgi:hypothetical protein